MSLSVTEKAAGEVKRLLESRRLPDTAGLKVAVKGGGCSGFSYVMDLAETPSDTDKIFDSQGVKIFVDAKSYLFLTGMELDYIDTVMERRFVFNNPNATKTCGCGQSFGV